VHVKVEPSVLGFMAKGPGHHGRADLRRYFVCLHTETVPDSILDRSRMSLIRFSKSVPAPWIVRANSPASASNSCPGCR